MFNFKKMNLGTAAALLVLGGLGGTAGTAALGVVSYDVHGQNVKMLQADSAKLDAAVHAAQVDPEAVKQAAEAVVQDAHSVAESFKGLSDSTKQLSKDIGLK